MKQTIFFTFQYITFSDTPLENYDLVIDSRADTIAEISRAKVVDFFEKYNSILFLCHTPREAYNKFCQEFIAVQAAGGVVKNSLGQTLMIYRNGYWDLPKGHLEKGESLAQCAVREVEEETSISGITLLEPLPSTQHTYMRNGQWELKTTHWWAMHSDSTSPKGQAEEGIERVEWCTKEELEQNLRNTYPTIKSLF